MDKDIRRDFNWTSLPVITTVVPSGVSQNHIGDVQVKGGQMRREKGGHLRDKNSALMGACRITFWSSPFVGTGRP